MMEIEDIPARCRSCEFILPYIQDIQRLETRQITPEIRERLISEKEYSAEDVDTLDAQNQLDLQECRQALSEVAVRTIGCAGLRTIVLNPEAQSSEGTILICQSSLETDESNEE